MGPPRQTDWIRYRSAAPGLDWAEAAFIGHRFSPHRHDTYAIGVTTRGVQAFRYRGADRHSGPGDAFFLHPDEVHDGGPGDDAGLGYRIVYVDPARISTALGGGPLPFVPDPVASAPEIARAVSALFPHRDDPREELRDTDVLCALAAVLEKASGRPAQTAASPDIVLLRLRARLAAACTDGFSMNELERETGRDRFTLARQFRRAFGVSPSRFVTLRRLELAQRLIAEGQPLAQVAAAAGFADQSHLTRQFLAAFGTTPGRWRDLLHAV